MAEFFRAHSFSRILEDERASAAVLCSGLAGSLGRFEPSWRGASVAELIYRLGAEPCRELEVRSSYREVGQERSGQPLSANFLGHEAHFPTSLPWTLEHLWFGGLHKVCPCWSGPLWLLALHPWSSPWLKVFVWSSSKK